MKKVLSGNKSNVNLVISPVIFLYILFCSSTYINVLAHIYTDTCLSVSYTRPREETPVMHNRETFKMDVPIVRVGD